MDSIVALHPDDVEFAHLKLISLFNAQKAGVGGIKGPTRQMIAQMQLGVSRSLRQYIGGNYFDVFKIAIYKFFMNSFRFLRIFDRKIPSAVAYFTSSLLL